MTEPKTNAPKLATGWNATGANASTIAKCRIEYKNSGNTMGWTLKRGVTMNDAVAFAVASVAICDVAIHHISFLDAPTKRVFGAFAVGADGTIAPDPDGLTGK